jgi:hypothetical protein
LENEILGSLVGESTEATTTTEASTSSSSWAAVSKTPPKECLYLDIDEKTRRPLLKVDSKITRYLKPHQLEGIKVCNVNRFKSAIF